MRNAGSLDIAELGEASRPELASMFATRSRRALFWRTKRIFDLVLCLVCLPVLIVCMFSLAVLNVFLNPGSLFFVQTRMGQHGSPFKIIKFRTMLPGGACRGPEDPVEVERITRFGSFLRKSRLDEIPQILNVLRGQMSIVGPRPDVYQHAQFYWQTVPLYKHRFCVKPGITGYAQVTSGYAEGSGGTVEKARRDAIYVRRACWLLDVKILLWTVYVVATGSGAK